jgi:predicted ester cyclase
MNSGQTLAFALRLMKEVWIPFDPTRIREFYHEDVIGHHVTQTIRLADVENRLRRDRAHWKDPAYDIRNLVAEPDKFALRFIFSATSISTGKRDEAETVYFYELKDGKIREFWTLASIDYDYFDKV